MKNHKYIRKLTAWTICLVMIISLFAVSAFAEACPCGGTAHWMEPSVHWTSFTHNVNGIRCTYRVYSGYKCLVCTTCGALLQEVPIVYEIGHTCK